jgi:predicted dehydrogenase
MQNNPNRFLVVKGGGRYIQPMVCRGVRRILERLCKFAVFNTPNCLKRNVQDKVISAGIIGCGHFVKNVYPPALNKRKLNLVCKSLLSNKLTDSKHVQKSLHYRTSCFESFDHFMNSGMNSIIVATPNNAHYDFIVAGIENGLNVFCEKPLVTEISEAYRIKNMLEKSSSVLMVGFQLRYSDIYGKLQSLIKNESLGRVLRVRVSHYLDLMDHLDESGWLQDRSKSGGGVLFNVGIHSINLILSLFGEVSKLSAQLENSSLYNALGEDTAYCRLDFKEGVTAKLSLSYLRGAVSDSEFKIMVSCENGLIVCDLYKNIIYIKDKKNREIKYIYFYDQDSDLIYKELTHFCYCVDKNIKPKTDIYDYIHTSLIIDALYESNNKKKSLALKDKTYG